MKRKSMIVAGLVALLVAGCGGSKADTVSSNISAEAEQFKVGRRIVVTNNITDKVEFEVVGRCSWENPPRQLEVTCQDVAPREGHQGQYTKATIGLGDNVSWASVQLGPITANVYRTKVIIAPTSIVPDFDLVTG